jgi:G6PDH family F420-dependent oxidoreductase
MVAVEPDEALVRTWDTTTGRSGDRKIGQIPICWDPERAAAISRAHEQFRWFAGGFKVNAELPGPAGFAGATQFVKLDDVADNIPCGPDPDAIVDAVSAFWKAGFTDIALIQIGDDSQPEFLRFAEAELLPALRKSAP